MTLWQDVRFAVRLLVKDKWFTAVAVLALALGIGVNNAVFTFVNAVLIRGLPLDEPDRVLSIGMTDARARQLGVSRLDFLDWREQARSFDAMAIVQGSPLNISEEGRPAEQYNGSYNSSTLFAIIGQQPLLGRDFSAADDMRGHDPVVILGNNVWQSRYGSDPSIVGRVIKVNGNPTTVIGVMPPDMKFPFNNDLWMPLSTLPAEIWNAKRAVRNFNVVARLSRGASISQARAELDAIVARLAREYPDTNKDLRADLMTYNDRMANGPIRVIFLALMGAVVFVLLIACANVANLLLARSATRSREIAVRVSLGASRWRIVRQLLVESVLLSAVAGVLGFALSVAGVRWFDAATSDVGKPYYMKFTMDPIVVLFFVAISVGTGILFGLAPALHVTRTDLNDVIKEAGGRSGTGGMRARRWTAALIVAEIALTLVLLAGAGFMMRSFLALYGTDVGVDTSRVLTMRMFLPLAKYPNRETRIALFERIEDRLRAVGSVRSAALTSMTPLNGGFVRQLAVDGRRAAAPGERLPEVTMLTVSAGYFETLGLTLQRGRTFDMSDGTAGHENAIVNQRFAAMHFAGEDPIGRRITLIDANTQNVQTSQPVSATIVGIAPNLRQRNQQEADPDPIVYLPYRSDPQRALTLMVRTAGTPAAATALIREEMRALEPDLPLFNIKTMDELMAQQRWPFKTFGTMFALFATIALLLSAIGLYAVTAYSVTQRTAEIGVRMALGARAVDVLWLVLRRSFAQLGIGLPIGIAGALGVGQLLRSVIVQTSTRDPITIASIGVLMAAVSIAACVWPARRAMRLDPVSALRYE